MYSFLSFLGGVGVIAAIVLTVLYFKRRKSSQRKLENMLYTPGFVLPSL